jgi:hypothetical protein
MGISKALFMDMLKLQVKITNEINSKGHVFSSIQVNSIETSLTNIWGSLAGLQIQEIDADSSNS